MITHEVEVLVAGLGPVGASCALALARQGISVAAVDAALPNAVDLRASTFHAPTIEMLDALGASKTLLEQGLKAPVYQYRDRQSGEVLSFDMAELADHTRFPFRIQCEQHRVTRELLDRLAEQKNVQLHHQQRLLFVEQDADGVTAYVETALAVEKYRAKYLVSADGASSVTRKVLGLGFPGFTYGEKFLCFSTEFPIEEVLSGLNHVNYISDPEEWMVLLRVPGLWRILVPADEQTSDADLLSDANKDAVFKRLLGQDMQVKTQHRTIYRVHQRVCERFAVGRVCLVGDAAHLNSPMGGFGMNSGIHDSINLAEKLVKILRHEGSPELIGQFERQRRTITEQFVQAQTIENTRAMKEGWGSARTSRRNALARLVDDAPARRAYLLKQSMFTSLADAALID